MDRDGKRAGCGPQPVKFPGLFFKIAAQQKFTVSWCCSAMPDYPCIQMVNSELRHISGGLSSSEWACWLMVPLNPLNIRLDWDVKSMEAVSQSWPSLNVRGGVEGPSGGSHTQKIRVFVRVGLGLTS